MKTVDMVASGYEWQCPTCYDDEDKIGIHKEIEILEVVTCPICGEQFKTREIYHAYE